MVPRSQPGFCQFISYSFIFDSKITLGDFRDVFLTLTISDEKRK